MFVIVSPARGANPQHLWQTPPDGNRGTGAGQIWSVSDVAADPTTGHVFVADGDIARISEFDAFGQFVKAWGWGVADGSDELQTCGPGAMPPTADCEAGISGGGVGQFGVFLLKIAVDDAGNVYVSDAINHRVQKFNSAGEFQLMFGGGVNQGPNHPGDVCTAAHLAEGDTCGVGVAGSGPGQFDHDNEGGSIAVGPGGSIFVGGSGRIQEFEADGMFKGQIQLQDDLTGAPTREIAIDQSGNLYLTVFSGAGLQDTVEKLSPAGAHLHTFLVNNPWSIAVDATGNLFAISDDQTPNKERREVVQFGPDGEVVIPAGSGFAPQAGGVGNGGVGLFGLATNTVTAAGGTDIFVTGTSGTGTTFLSAYGAAPDKWPPPVFPPIVAAQYANAVDSDAATLGAQINPRFWQDTSYYLEYGTGVCSQGGCPTQVPAPPGTQLGAGVVSTAVATKPVTLTDLLPGTTYNYRFVAQSSGGGPVFGTGQDPTFVAGGEASFTTRVLPTGSTACLNQALRLGAATGLPDCRAYEMVSPVDKNNTDIIGLINVQSNLAMLNQGTPDGGKITYTTSQGFGDTQGTPYVSQYIASRGANGWSSHGITPPQGFSPIEIGQRADLEFRAFTADLCSAVLRHDTDLLLAPGAAQGAVNIYRRQNCGEEGYTAMTDLPWPTPTVKGFSADGRCAVYVTNELVTSNEGLYISCGGESRLLSVLPSGNPFKASAAVGTGNDSSGFRSASATRAVSADGSRVYWSDGGFGPATLFLRENPLEEQSKVSAGKCTEPGKACTLKVSGTVDNAAAHFWSASLDGAKALFSIVNPTSDFDGNLYLFDREDKIQPTDLIAGEVIDVVGASEDAARVTFASGEVLTSEPNAQGASPAPGQPNLYLFDAGADDGERFHFIGTLSKDDARTLATAVPSALSYEPFKKSSRVSPDGRQIVFMSNAPLTGYDNTDVQNGEAIGEVFAYDATAGGGEGRLRCVSCNPTGQRPRGRNLMVEGHFSNVWAAAMVPGYATELYGSRVISDDGKRVYFNAYEPLVSRDTNGRGDVYQWEALGSGDCTASSSAYSPLNEGCVSLISSGEGSTDSEFVNASADGRDVFFATASSLVPQDPGLIDIYDARAGGGYPAPPSPPSACEGEACQGPVSVPNDPTPASATFNGGGNVKPKPKPCPKGKVRRKGRCVKKHKKGNKTQARNKRAGKNGRTAR